MPSTHKLKIIVKRDTLAGLVNLSKAWGTTPTGVVYRLIDQALGGKPVSEENGSGVTQTERK